LVCSPPQRQGSGWIERPQLLERAGGL
jgi:hypothetical protein